MTVAWLLANFISHVADPADGQGQQLMDVFDGRRMLLHDLPIAFLGEVAVRAIVAYVLIFMFLKLSGRRGIRQLSVFELVIILILGSSAGDVTIYEDVPFASVFVVFVVVLLLYRLTTFLIGISPRFEGWVDGKPITLINRGHYETDSLARLNISEDEFFMELRQMGVEHLGQVKLAIVETDGDVSVFFYERDDIKPGLSVLPPDHRTDYETVPADGLYCCNCCGKAHELHAGETVPCSACGKGDWSVALHSRR